MIENLREQIFQHEIEKKELKEKNLELKEKHQESERLNEELQLNWGISKKVNSQLEEEIQSKKEIQEKLVLEEKNGELLKRKLEEAEKLKMDFSAKLEKEVDTHRILSEKLSLEHFKNTIPGTIDNTSDFIDQIRQLNNEKQNLVCDLKAAQAYSRKLEEDQVKQKQS